jgi:hypothetical protein
MKPQLQGIHLCSWTSLAWHVSDEATRGTSQTDFGEELRDSCVASAVGAALRSEQLDIAGNRSELNHLQRNFASPFEARRLSHFMVERGWSANARGSDQECLATMTQVPMPSSMHVDLFCSSLMPSVLHRSRISDTTVWLRLVNHLATAQCSDTIQTAQARSRI